MYVRCNPNKKNVKYLSYVRGYRDKNGISKQITVEKIGDWEDLIKIYDDPIKHFNDIANDREKELLLNNELIIKTNEILSDDFSPLNLGYIILKKIYNELKIKNFLNDKQNNLNINYKLNDILELLIYSRVLYPGSKLDTYNNKESFFDNFDFSLKDLYRSLDYFNSYKDEILTLIWNNTKDKYNRDTSISYYDCTNYYFEISYNDEDLLDEFGNIIEKGYRKKGPSKEHRKTPIIQLGLLMDNKGIPLSYDLFPGNESEKLQMRPSLKKTKAKFGIDRTIIVADRGQNTSDNTVFIAGKNDDAHINHDGYVYGQSIIGADQEFKNWAINTNDFIIDKFIEDNTEITFKHKSRVYAKKVQIKKDDKRTVNYLIYQKQLVYYSQKYADKQKYERELAIKKAEDLINNPGKYTQATSYGCTKYINNIKFDTKTGEIPEGLELSLKLDKIKEEEKYDGYYSIVTSEKYLSDKEIRDIYKGLWKIEESFKITKTNLETRPIYVWTKEHIEAHFLTCFISLVILRLLEQKIDKKYSTNQIINDLKKLTCTNINSDYFIINYRTPLIKDLELLFKLNFSEKFIKIQKIRKYLK